MDVLNSQMGRRPERAAPTAIPAKPDSVIGVWSKDQHNLMEMQQDLRQSLDPPQIYPIILS